MIERARPGDSLTTGQCLAVIERYCTGRYSYLEICRWAGISTRTAWKVMHFKSPYHLVRDAVPAEMLARLEQVRVERRGSGNPHRARRIRRILDRGYTAVEAAEIAGVAYETAYCIATGRTYAWLDEVGP